MSIVNITIPTEVTKIACNIALHNLLYVYGIAYQDEMLEHLVDDIAKEVKGFSQKE